MSYIIRLCALAQIAMLFLSNPSTAAPSKATCWSCFLGATEVLKGEFQNLVGSIYTAEPKPAFEMELLHVNDMHAHFEQTNKMSGVCTPLEAEQELCVGGFARVSTVIKQAREAAERQEIPPVLVLNAGDNFQGSIYYTLFKAEIVTKFVNLLHFDAMNLGNHDFDDGPEVLEPFLRHVDCPVVAANVNISKSKPLAGINLPPSVVLEVGGQKVGIIGYLTPETKDIADTRDVEITDEIEAVKIEAKRLSEQGIKIIIGLGHSGFNVDQKMALEVPEIDLIVGAHSHTFLYNEDEDPLPDPKDIPSGRYPTIITQKSGKKVPVVQAYANTKYIGRLRMSFDEDGELTSVAGKPLLLDKNVPEDPDVLAELNVWKEKVLTETNKVVGKSLISLDKTGCRYSECNVGNILADAYIYSRIKSLKPNATKGWTDAPIALVSSGCLRSSINPKSKNYTVTVRDVIEVIPFQDKLELVKLKGDVLMEVLEHSVKDYDPKLADNKGGFLQVSGLQVTYNIDKPSGHRVERVLARCGQCAVPRYYPLKNDKTYSVLIRKFMSSRGGDGYSMIKQKGEITSLDDTDTEAFQTYIKDMSPIYTEIGSRITIKNSAIAN